MNASEFCNREVVVIEKDASVADAANLMRKYHVGSVVVVEPGDMKRHPIGILTDRDIVMEFVAADVSPGDIAAGDAMTAEFVTIGEDTSLFETGELMRKHGVRRLPVVNRRGELIGLVAVDDVLELLAEQLSDLVAVVAKQRRRESSRLT